MAIKLPVERQNDETYLDILDKAESLEIGDTDILLLARINYQLSILNNNLYYLASALASMSGDTENSEIPKVNK
jgi:hypothetical protein